MDLTTQDILAQLVNNKPKLPMQTLGMPGASHVMGMAQNVAKAVPEYTKDMFGRMKRAVTEGPYSSPTGEYDPSIGTLPLEVMMPGYGRAVGSVGAFGVGNKATGALSNPQMQSTLKNLMEKYKDTPGKIKLIAKEFRSIHPEYTGSDGTIQRVGSRIHNWGGTNIETGAKSSKDIELGAFGGRGRLNTESPGESINWLQQQRPVTREWVEEWAKDANVPIKSVTGSDTKYLKLEGQKRPGDKDVTVRLPQDEGLHAGSNVKPSEVGNLFDTGIGNEKPSGGKLRYRPFNEFTRINESAMSYANPEALDAALKWRLSKAPHGGNWLIPEEMAPRLPNKTPKPTPNRDYIDLNQLILDLLLKRQ